MVIRHANAALKPRYYHEIGRGFAYAPSGGPMEMVREVEG